MSYNTFPKWDKNRPIFFQIGLILALALANIVINYESIPSIPQYDVEDLSALTNTVDILIHQEMSFVNKSMSNKPTQVLAKILPPVFELQEKKEISHEDEPTFLPPNQNVSTSVIKSDQHQENQNIIPSKPPTTYTVVDRMPCLLGCEQLLTEEERKSCTQKALLSYIHQNLTYPPLARNAGIEGTVIVSFVIDKSGDLRDLTIIRDIGAGCGNAAVKVIKELEKWVAGSQNNHAVHVKYTLPVKFKLQ